MQTMPTSSGHQAVIAEVNFMEYAFYDSGEATCAGKTVMIAAIALPLTYDQRAGREL
jgi:hypothetical protein